MPNRLARAAFGGSGGIRIHTTRIKSPEPVYSGATPIKCLGSRLSFESLHVYLLLSVVGGGICTATGLTADLQSVGLTRAQPHQD